MEKLLSVTSLLRRDALAANGKELVDMDDVIPVGEASLWGVFAMTTSLQTVMGYRSG